jgi:hypothetical protein
MNAPCKCTHPADDHRREGLAPQCVAPNCTCLNYRPVDGSATPTPQRPSAVGAPSAGTGAPTIEQLINQGRRSDSKRLANLAGKIADLVDRLRVEVRRESEMAAAQQEIAALERKLAEAKAKLRKPISDKPATAPLNPGTASTGAHACPDCDRTFSNRQGLGAHRAHAHGYRRAAS